jgi:hypothetical protein
MENGMAGALACRYPAPNEKQDNAKKQLGIGYLVSPAGIQKVHKSIDQQASCYQQENDARGTRN